VSSQLAETISHALNIRVREIGAGARHDDLYLRRSGMASVQHQAVSSGACQPVNQWKSFMRATNCFSYPSFAYVIRATEVGGSVKHARMIVIHTKNFAGI
jgi:hypothetical protein